MSAQIPIKGDAQANETAMNKVKADKLREVTYGHDGTWIAHPLINEIAMKVFNEHMLGPNQVSKLSLYFSTCETDILLVSIMSAERNSRSGPLTSSIPK